MKGNLFLLCLSAIFICCVFATSDSDPNLVYLCDALSPRWGCEPRFWTGGNRLRCQNTTQIMNWATKPARSNCYRVVAGDESNPTTFYTPDTYINIHIRVTCLDKLYRGILLYAVNSTNGRVGEWNLPQQDPPLFKLPYNDDASHSCYGSLMHATAELKPYHVVLQFKAPPVGTGRITFRCLIKYGNANTGDFYWPNLAGDLALNEGPMRAPFSVSWERSQIGQSCTAKCAQSGRQCSESALQSLTSSVVANQVSAVLPCEVPLVSGCGAYGSAFDPRMGLCYYKDSNCTGRTPSSVTCATVVPAMAQNCPCLSGGSSGVTGEVEVSPASSRAPGLLAVVLLVPFMLLSHPRLSFFLLLVLSFTHGHNWLNSLSRSPAASTYRPCKPPLTDMPHAQVGPNQHFEIEWMNGHGGDTYFVIVHSRNADKLKSHTTTMLEDYINLAPVGSNRALDPMRQRFHRKESPSLNNTYTTDAGMPVTVINYFREVVNTNDARYLYRPTSFGGRIGGIVNPTAASVHYQMAYTLSELANDRIISYNSSKYPWIEAVYKFRITAYQPVRPDTARFYIPGFGGFGRYVVQYLWRGYYDCVDVDYKPDPVPNVYGIGANATLWMRIDHCLFHDVRNVYRSSEIVSEPSFCTSGCNTDCYGVNVVPLKAPTSAYQGFAAPTNVTWRYPNVYGADIYVPWNHGTFNLTRDAYMAVASEKRYMCYSVQPKQFTDTEDEYKVTNDPDDPVFYSTCYYRYSGNIFPEYMVNYSSPFVNIPWRYFSKCIDCESRARNIDPATTPKWTITDKCINCNLEPVTPAPPAAPIVVENTSRCDGLGTWRNANHTTCPNTTQCVKQLWHIGRSANVHIPLDDCRYLAAADPECSSHWFHRNVTLTSFRCYCYRNLSCCRTCSRVPDVSATQYETATRPDPTCARGVLSSDSSACCSASCGAGNCIANTAVRPQVGFCCSTCINRPCSQYGPPCKMGI